MVPTGGRGAGSGTLGTVFFEVSPLSFRPEGDCCLWAGANARDSSTRRTPIRIFCRHVFFILRV